MRLKSSVFMAIMLFGCFALSAQDSIEREKEILDQNISLYIKGEYEKAAQNFRLMIDRLPDSRYLTTYYLMLIKSEYKLNNYELSIQTARKFLQMFPKSLYIDDVHYMIGNSFYRLNRFTTALTAWEDAIERTTDNRLRDRIGLLITRTIRYRLDRMQREELNDLLTSETGQLLIQIALTEDEIEQGRIAAARQRINEAMSRYAGNYYIDRARRLLSDDEVPIPGKKSLAVLLPLTGPNGEIGQAIQQGVEYALKEYNQKNNTPIDLVVMDYADDLVSALTFYQELARDINVLGVLGPIENDFSAACAALSGYESLPLVSPTSTNGNINLLSDKYFQLNPGVTHRAEYLAKYVADSLKLKRVATFAPLENHFITMVDRFSEIMQSEGVTMVAQEWYYPGDQDFNKQFMNIKRIGLKLEFQDSLLTADSLINPARFDSLYSIFQKMEREEAEEENIEIDSVDIPVTSIDGMFVPIYQEDLQYIAPQIAYNNIQTRLFGNSDWYNEELLKRNKNYINGLIFVSDGFIDEEDWDYKQFRNRYRSEMKTTPTRYNLIGYDSFQLMLQPLSEMQSPVSRLEYFQRLQQIKSYKGIYRSFLISNDLSNRSIKLLRYEYGQIIPLN